MPMRVVIAGGSGLLGQALTRRLVADGHTVTILSRSDRERGSGAAITHVAWKPDGTSGPWASSLNGADVVVNLSGAGMGDKRWTAARRRLLESSRLESTASLVTAIAGLPQKPGVFVQGSAVGYYGGSLDDRAHDESSPAGTDFLGDLARRWEAAAAPVAAHGCRLVVVRSGVVLDMDGGALPKMALPFKLFVGGPVGSGRQVLSWIHHDDWRKLMMWLIERPDAAGAFNACSPRPVTNREFSREVGRALHRPSWAPVPGFVLRTLFGEMADAMLLKGQRAIPARAQVMGFQFDYPTIDTALRQIFRSPAG
jgi:uncharacterized protein (TIGR01777 family)